MKYCVKCGNNLPDPNPKFCPDCGHNLEATITCPQCKATLPVGSKFCPNCGHDMSKPASGEVTPEEAAAAGAAPAAGEEAEPAEGDKK